MNVTFIHAKGAKEHGHNYKHHSVYISRRVIKKIVGVSETCSAHREHNIYTDFSYTQLNMNIYRVQRSVILLHDLWRNQQGRVERRFDVKTLTKKMAYSSGELLQLSLSAANRFSWTFNEQRVPRAYTFSVLSKDCSTFEKHFHSISAKRIPHFLHFILKKEVGRGAAFGIIVVRVCPHFNLRTASLISTKFNVSIISLEVTPNIVNVHFLPH